MSQLSAEILVPGAATAGQALVLSAPISFWGGVNPQTGMIIDVRHPEHGTSISQTILCLPGTIGSSSAAAVLLELVYARRAPKALVMHEPDAILLLGLIVAREMGYETPPAYRLDRDVFSTLQGCEISIHTDGTIAA